MHRSTQSSSVNAPKPNSHFQSHSYTFATLRNSNLRQYGKSSDSTNRQGKQLALNSAKIMIIMNRARSMASNVSQKSYRLMEKFSCFSLPASLASIITLAVLTTVHCILAGFTNLEFQQSVLKVHAYTARKCITEKLFQ